MELVGWTWLWCLSVPAVGGCVIMALFKFLLEWSERSSSNNEVGQNIRKKPSEVEVGHTQGS